MGQRAGAGPGPSLTRIPGMGIPCLLPAANLNQRIQLTDYVGVDYAEGKLLPEYIRNPGDQR